MGVPDVHCLYRNKEFWIELKELKGNHIYVEPAQLRFAVTRNCAHPNVFLLAMNERKGCLLQFHSKPPYTAVRDTKRNKVKLKINLKDVNFLLIWNSKPDWKEIRRAIMKGL